MAYKGFFLVAILGFLALAHADPLRRPKSPAGKCPAHNGPLPTYLPDTENCHIFYECNEGEPVQKECLPNLCFDSTLNVCAFPDAEKVIAPLSAVGTCPPRDTNETIYLPDNANCTIYYVCSNGNAIQNSCPPDMSWNNVAHICDWDIDANCNLDGNSSIASFSAVGQCPAKDGATPVYLPDDQKDNIYYECSNGVAIQNVCPPDLIWNTQLNVCVVRQPKAKPFVAVGECPAKDGATPVYLPDSEKNNIYYECSNGVAIQNECPPDLIWNNQLHVCDFAPPKSIKPFVAVGECPAKDGATPVYLPDSEKNNIYYECSNGVAIQNECPPDLIWNNQLHVCDFAPPKSIKPFVAVGECPAKDGATPVYLPDSEKNNIYYECSNGVAIQNECPPDLIWNNQLHVCDFAPPKSIKPFAAVGVCPAKDGATPVYLPDSEDCSTYYECSNGVAIQNVCPPDLVWNTVKNTCDWESSCTSQFIAPLAAIGTCPPRDGNETVFLTDSENCTIYYICSNGRPIAASCTPGMAWNSKLNICDWEIDVDCSRKLVRKPVGECPPTDPANPIYLPDSDSCKLYYECSNGVAIQNECPPGLEFNPTLSVCDEPLDAGCKATGTTDPTSSSSTTSTSTSTSTSSTPAPTTSTTTTSTTQ